MTNDPEGILFDLAEATAHDGPGLRITVFLKGCPLRCRWCSNPEGISPERELNISAVRCIGIEKCGRCLKACSQPQKRFALEQGFVKGVDRA